MQVIIQEENFKDCIDEIEILTRLHFIEFNEERIKKDSRIVYEPNKELFIQLDNNDLLICICMRKDNKLIGYSLNVLGVDNSCKSLVCSRNEMLFVHKEHRGRDSLRLINFTESCMINYNVNYHIWGVKPNNDYSKYLTRQGYEKEETFYIKNIGGN